MKLIRLLNTILLLLIVASCSNDTVPTEQSYVFTKPYCAIVTVGGVVGLAEKCYKIGDLVTGKENTSGKLTIRIAEHSSLNDGPPTSASYQEFLDVPINYLKIMKK